MMNRSKTPAAFLQRGATMLEFAVVGPVITLLGLACLQYGHLFFVKNHFNHATFMAARAGSMGNADPAKIRIAYARALVPVFGGGTDDVELAESYARAFADVTLNSRIELLNPTRESFEDWNEPALQNAVGGGRRVIPNGGLAARNPATVGTRSGQSIHDANLIRLRITHGYAPWDSLRFVSRLYTKYLTWLDPGTDAYRSQLIARGLIPVVTHATVQMQSDAIEPDSPVSIPGAGNQGTPTDPGKPPAVTKPPPDCRTIGCTTTATPLDPGGGGNSGGGTGCEGGNCPSCGSPAPT